MRAYLTGLAFALYPYTIHILAIGLVGIVLIGIGVPGIIWGKRANSED